jgi:hypothetical protein
MNEKERGTVLGLIAAMEGIVAELKRHLELKPAITKAAPEPEPEVLSTEDPKTCQHPEKSHRFIQTMGHETTICLSCGSSVPNPRDDIITV